MTDVLLYGDTLTSADLRHAVPTLITDPFGYLEHGGRRYVAINQLDEAGVRELGGYEVLRWVELGYDDLVTEGVPPPTRGYELILRACREVGLTEAVVPPGLGVGLADHLRAAGIELRPDAGFFQARRRAKTPTELEGIRCAQRLAEEVVAALAAALRRGGELTSEGVRAEARAAIAGADASVEDLFAAVGDQALSAHDPGHGPIEPGQSVVVDLALRDNPSGCYADMSRTFCLGEPSAELARMHGLCRQALDVAVAAIRPGAKAEAIDRVVCELFQEHGYPTQRTKAPGETLEEGFFHGLGHGVGLQVHEAPSLSRAATEELVEGDVLAVEPGLYRRGVGGVRLEDLVLVTADGCEVLTRFPYELEP